MAGIKDIIRQVRGYNPALADQLQYWVKNSSHFGLNFEHDMPEAVRLWGKPPVVGDPVNILPPRGKAETPDSNVRWTLEAIKGGMASLVRTETDSKGKKAAIHASAPLSDIVSLGLFNRPIYPGLRLVDKIQRGSSTDPWNVVINAENFHALEMLEYTCAGKVRVCYLDPPYNTGAKDWKYNNNYVDGSDAYRHSKWLSFMEHRLRLVRKLLDPRKSVLICTIDEKERPRLELLLDQMFPEARIQMVTSVISRAGSYRHGSFTRKCEYLYFVMIGDAAPARNTIDYLSGKQTKEHTYWYTMTRHGSNDLRTQEPTMFYPVFFSKIDGSYVKCGNPLPVNQDKNKIPVPEGCFAVWPQLDKQGRERIWSLSPEGFNKRYKEGFIKLGPWKKGQNNRAISYALRSAIRDVKNGKLKVIGHNKDGSVKIESKKTLLPPSDVFNLPSNDATTYGTRLLNNIIGPRFSYPKSLYAVRDCIGLFCKDDKNALILDFFAGSGTTLQAVNLLNAEDGGHRQCILVTNNEVSAAEAKAMTRKGLRQGDPEWEKLGIARYVTWPRTVCTIKGVDITGKPLAGTYLDTDIPMSDGFHANAAFFDLTYEDPDAVRFDNAFKAVAPILWLQAGAQGPIIMERKPRFALTPYYGILFDPVYASQFADATAKQGKTFRFASIVTDDKDVYRSVCNMLPGRLRTQMLYRNYLDTFSFIGEEENID